MTEEQERAEALRPINTNIYEQFKRVAPTGIRLYSPGDRKSPRGYEVDLVDNKDLDRHFRVTFAKNGRIDNVTNGFKDLPLCFKHEGILLSFIQFIQVGDETVQQVTKEFVFNKFGDAKEVVRTPSEKRPQLPDLSREDYDTIFTVMRKINAGEIKKNS